MVTQLYIAILFQMICLIKKCMLKEYFVFPPVGHWWIWLPV